MKKIIFLILYLMTVVTLVIAKDIKDERICDDIYNCEAK